MLHAIVDPRTLVAIVIAAGVGSARLPRCRPTTRSFTRTVRGTVTDVTHDPAAWSHAGEMIWTRCRRTVTGPGGRRTGQAHALHADASHPTPGSAVADVPRGGCRDGPLLPRQAADRDRCGRPHTRPSIPAEAGAADRLSRLPGTLRRAAHGLARRTGRLLVPCHKQDAMPRYEADVCEQLASPLRPSLLEDLLWHFHTPSTPSARFASKPSIARGDGANRSWMPPCR
jgi:hypothetical protein